MPKMESALKKRRIEPNRSAPSQDVINKSATSSHGPPGPVVQACRIDSKIQQAKKFAVAQAHQEGCLGNFRSFDSPFGNYLVPVIPTRADLFGSAEENLHR